MTKRKTDITLDDLVAATRSQEDDMQPTDIDIEPTEADIDMQAAPSNSYQYREQWLHALKDQLTIKLFEPAYEVPANIRISCGFPSRNALNGVAKQALGQCWADEKSADKHFEIFVSPVIGDEQTAAAILAHELCHAVAGVDAKHGPLFKAVATEIGLEGKMTSTVAGAKFKETMVDILDIIGPYPHASLDARKMSNGVKKQSTRLLKAQCEMCSYTVRITQRWVDDVGAPHCPLHGEMVVHN